MCVGLSAKGFDKDVISALSYYRRMLTGLILTGLFSPCWYSGCPKLNGEWRMAIRSGKSTYIRDLYSW